MWFQQSNHIDDCYFCLSRIRGGNSKNRKKLFYPRVESVEFPLYTTNCSANSSCGLITTSCSSIEKSDSDMSVDFSNDSVPKQLTISEFNNIVKTCSLSKHKSLLLAGSLRKNNLLEKTVTNRRIKNRDQDYRDFFDTTTDGTFCTNIPSKTVKFNPFCFMY